MGLFDFFFSEPIKTNPDIIKEPITQEEMRQQARLEVREKLRELGIPEYVCGKSAFEIEVIEVNTLFRNSEDEGCSKVYRDCRIQKNEDITTFLERSKRGRNNTIQLMGGNIYQICFDDIDEELLNAVNPDIVYFRIFRSNDTDINIEEVRSLVTCIEKRKKKIRIVLDLDKCMKGDDFNEWLEIPHDIVCRSRLGRYIDWERGVADILKHISELEHKNGIVYNDVSQKESYRRAVQEEHRKLYKCELCQGTSWRKEGPSFVCKSCGCEYSLNEMQNLAYSETYYEEDRTEIIQIALEIELDKIMNMDFPEGLTVISNVFINRNEVYFLAHGKYIKVDCEYGTYQTIENLNFAVKEKLVLRENTVARSVINTVGHFIRIITHCMEYNEDDVCNSLNVQGNQLLKAYNIEMRLTKKSFKFIHSKKFISIENVLRMILKMGEVKGEPEKLIFEIPEEWRACKGVIDTGIPRKTASIIPKDTAYFTDSTYVCTSCKRNLNKVLITRGSKVNVAKQKIEIDKVFSCKYCNSFYAPLMNQRLNCGVYLYLKTDSNRYLEIVKCLDNSGRRAE